MTESATAPGHFTFQNQVLVSSFVPTAQTLGFADRPHRLQLDHGMGVLCVMVEAEDGTVYNWNRSVSAANTVVEYCSYTPGKGISPEQPDWYAGPCEVLETNDAVEFAQRGFRVRLSPKEIRVGEGDGDVDLTGDGLARAIHVLMPADGEDILYRGTFWEVTGTVAGRTVRGSARYVQLYCEEGKSWWPARFWRGGIETAWWIGYNVYDDGTQEMAYLVSGAGDWGWTIAVTRDGVTDVSDHCDDEVELGDAGYPSRLVFAHPANQSAWVCEAYQGSGFTSKADTPNPLWSMGTSRRVGEMRSIVFSLGLLESFADVVERRGLLYQ